MWNWADNPWAFGFGGIVAASMLGGLYWLDHHLRLVYRRSTARPQREKPGDARWDPWEEDDPSLPWVLLLLGLFAGFFSIGFRFFLSSYLLWLGFRESRVWKAAITLIFLAMPFGVGVVVWWVWTALRGLTDTL
jgi:hypothetical protein